jgi:UDP-N-acetylmuramoylalanine--D-glutamate ligase
MGTLVYGLAVAGRAVAQYLRDRGEDVTLADDTPTDEHRDFARAIGAPLLEGAALTTAVQDVAGYARLVPSPGVPESHPIVRAALAAGVDVISEIELGYRDEMSRAGGPRPFVAITGTDGKTTTTLMAAAMLRSAGHRARAVGNTELPLVAALGSDDTAFAIECSSFRLAFTRDFRAAASVWLNLAPDHLDWHVDIDSYRHAKERIWAAATSDDVAVAPVRDAAIVASARRGGARVVTFGLDEGDYRCENGWLVSPHGRIVERSALSRDLPHDVTNALAASAAVLEAKLGTPSAVAEALGNFRHAAHRIEFVAEIDGVRWFNDSKATSPHAARAAITSFEGIVLIAGGKNKGLDLSEMARDIERIRAVVATGAAGPDVAAAFAGRRPVRSAASMREAVEHARELARPGDVVLLSPGCTSYDWYRNYGERGDDFRHLVTELAASTTASTTTGMTNRTAKGNTTT